MKNKEEGKEKLNVIEATTNEFLKQIESKKEELKEYDNKDLKLQEIEKEIHLMKHQIKDLKVQYDKINTMPLYQDLKRKKEELTDMLQQMEKAKEDLFVEKKKLESEQTNVKNTIQGIDTEIITIHINTKRVEELLAEELKLVNRKIPHKQYRSMNMNNIWKLVI